MDMKNKVSRLSQAPTLSNLNYENLVFSGDKDKDLVL
jgi:hypothetical protein